MTKNFALRMALARQLADLSLKELANRTGVSKQAIHKYERGDMAPSSSVLIELARALRVSVDFFSRTGVATDITLVKVEHREKERLNRSEIDTIKAKTILLLESLLELERIAESKTSFKNPVEGVTISNLKDAAHAAVQVRKKWKLGSGPIKNVLSMLEHRGIKVFAQEFGSNFNGFSAWAGKIPIVVVNAGVNEVTRIRFTALHELGHLVLEMSEGLSERMIERICNEFAGELLFPAEMVIVEFGKGRSAISMEELRIIKERYGISIMAIMVKASSLEVISRSTYNSWKLKYDQWVLENSMDFGNYQYEERTGRFEKLLNQCLIENKISVGKACALSGRSEVDILQHVNTDREIYSYAAAS